MLISKIFLWSECFERTWVWSEPVSSALQSDHKWLQAQLGLIITFSSALESDHSLIQVWAMVWIWVWTMVWRWSDQNAFVLKSLIRDPLCRESVIRSNLGLEKLIRVNLCRESLIRDNFGLESLIRQKFGSWPQPGSWFSSKFCCWTFLFYGSKHLPSLIYIYYIYYAYIYLHGEKTFQWRALLEVRAMNFESMPNCALIYNITTGCFSLGFCLQDNLHIKTTFTLRMALQNL